MLDESFLSHLSPLAYTQTFGYLGFSMAGVYAFVSLKLCSDGRDPVRFAVPRLVVASMIGMIIIFMIAAAEQGSAIASVGVYILTFLSFYFAASRTILLFSNISLPFWRARGTVRVFTTFVSQSVIKRRLLQIVWLGAIMGAFYPIEGFWWPMTIPIIVIFSDLLMILYRRSIGLYGRTEIEFAEAVRYVLTEQKSGCGPGHFDRVFPLPKRQTVFRPDPHGHPRPRPI